MKRVISTIEELRFAFNGVTPGLVPTMGALHEGHLSLIRRSAAENQRTVVSVFVNPSQFSDQRDLARYPRNLEHDATLAFDVGANVVFAPDVETIYPRGFSTWVEVGGLSERWEGEFRPGHFKGVATVVSILLNIVRPERAYFGEKDYQQLAVIRRLQLDLKLPGEIVGCPTVRDADGLALSSRNVRLSHSERIEAAAIPRSLFHMVNLAKNGQSNVQELVAAGTTELKSEPGIAVDYLAIVDPNSLESLTRLIPGARALVAVRLGDVRLIDNVEIVGGSPE